MWENERSWANDRRKYAWEQTPLSSQLFLCCWCVRVFVFFIFCYFAVSLTTRSQSLEWCLLLSCDCLPQNTVCHLLWKSTLHYENIANIIILFCVWHALESSLTESESERAREWDRNKSKEQMTLWGLFWGQFYYLGTFATSENEKSRHRAAESMPWL